ncbi:MAG: cache domain-containing protein [Oligoflexia bacterium]|nr:cache domain-containing protein [Oligoflexia bacterium]
MFRKINSLYSRILLFLFLSLFFINSIPQNASATNNNDLEKKCIDLVEKGVEHIKKVGIEQAFKDFKDYKKNFISDELYLFTFNTKGECIQHAINPKLVGVNLTKIQDTKGKLFIKELIDKSNSNLAGWIDYYWTNPKTKKITPKKTYYIRENNIAGGIILSSGFYLK